MFNFISGILREKTDGIAVIETGGIGFEIQISEATRKKLPDEGEKVKIYTYMSVKEDGITLCGFYSSREKKMFMQLIGISGIGVKAAMTILSGLEISELIASILSGDAKTIASIKGVGKKTAERIVLELKDKLDKDADAGAYIGYAPAERRSQRDTKDAVSALLSLGFSKQEAEKAVKEVANDAGSIEELITAALRSLSSL